MSSYSKIILNIPHSSAFIPVNTWNGDIQSEVNKWTDWFTDIIFKPRGIDDRIVPVVFSFSRFFCDVERLKENEPLEEVGQGRFYTNFNGCTREKEGEAYIMAEQACLLHDILLSSQINGNDNLIIDCHSFPSELASDIDICLGWNNDWSKPSDALIEQIKGYFEGFNYKVAFNAPYSNSITPDSPHTYHSLMIEVNKKVYMNEESLKLLGSAYKFNIAMWYLYKNILDKWKY